MYNTVPPENYRFGWLSRTRNHLGYALRRQWFIYAMLLPSFILLTMFVYYPAGEAMIMSLFDWKPGVRTIFIGLHNFKRVVEDPAFWISWRNVVLMGLWKFTIPFIVPLAMAEAIFNLRNRASSSFYRVVLLIPALVPSIVSLMLWKWLYGSEGGINLMLDAIGLGELARPWLGTQETALAAVLFVGFPWVTGVDPLIYLAGLLNISEEMIDASQLDGCSTWQRIWYVDLPHLSGQIRLLLMLGIINLLRRFGDVLALTEGGPGSATVVPGLYLYKKAFGIERFEKMDVRLGEACAAGVIIFTVIFILTFISNRYGRKSGIEDYS